MFSLSSFPILTGAEPAEGGKISPLSFYLLFVCNGQEKQVPSGAPAYRFWMLKHHLEEVHKKYGWGQRNSKQVFVSLHPCTSVLITHVAPMGAGCGGAYCGVVGACNSLRGSAILVCPWIWQRSWIWIEVYGMSQLQISLLRKRLMGGLVEGRGVGLKM